ncbi:MAG: fimbrillin family protein [Bacteroidales bacterium]|jgi:hypothetical protein|nr:fimbrillin family protein [Bacteroidales bacterium]
MNNVNSFQIFKRKNYFLALVLFLVGCSSGDDPAPQPITYSLKISPSLERMHYGNSRGAIIERFGTTDKIGLYATGGRVDQPYDGNSGNLNFPASFDGSVWVHKDIELKDDPVFLYSYYPYSESIHDAILPVDASEQIDYLYGVKATASKDRVTADITMKHGLSLVSFYIHKNDYQYEGRVTKIEIEGIHTTGELDITTGDIVKTGEITSLSDTFDYTLDDSNLQKLSIITLPTNMADYEDVIFYITIDGDEYIYYVSKIHHWRAEYEYIYSLNLHKKTGTPHLLPEDTQLDVVYWSTFGKTDPITLGNSRTSLLRIDPFYQNYGRTYIKGEAGYFGNYATNTGSEKWEGRFRMALYNGETLVEQSQPYNINELRGDGYFTSWLIPFYINCAPGTYTVKPLFQAKGEEEWICPRLGSTCSEEDFIVTVLESYDVPRCRNFNLIREYSADNEIFMKRYDTPFETEVRLVNKSNQRLKGEVKAVFHRTFGDFYSQSQNDGNTWADEVGRISVDLPVSDDIQLYSLSCCITERRTLPDRYSPVIHLYFKADGSDEWKFITVDCNVTLEALKDVTEEIIWGLDEDGERTSIGGLDYVLAYERSVNYLYIKPKE